MKTLTFLFMLTCAISCKKENIITDNDGFDTGKIYGKWNWVNSTGGFAGTTFTPELAGYSESVEYKGNKNVYRYRNDTLKNQAKYAIAKGRSLFSEKPAYIIKYTSEAINQVVIKATNDTLILADNVYDGFTILYVKDK